MFMLGGVGYVCWYYCGVVVVGCCGWYGVDVGWCFYGWVVCDWCVVGVVCIGSGLLFYCCVWYWCGCGGGGGLVWFDCRVVVGGLVVGDGVVCYYYYWC